MKFAKHKGIKLAILREFRPSDWNGRIREIHIKAHITTYSDPKVSLLFAEDRYIEKLKADMDAQGMNELEIWKGQDVFLNVDKSQIQVNEYIEGRISEYKPNGPGLVELDIPFVGATIEVSSRGGIPLQGIRLQFEVLVGEDDFRIMSDKIARLLLEGFQDKEAIIYEEDLRRVSIDEVERRIVGEHHYSPDPMETLRDVSLRIYGRVTMGVGCLVRSKYAFLNVSIGVVRSTR